MDSPFLKGYWGTPENMTPRGARRSWHEKKWPSKRDSRDKSTPLRHDGAHRPSKSPVSIPVESVADSSSSKYQFQAKKKKNYKLWPKINPAAAAFKIQAAYRGFGVRKSALVKNLKAIAQAKESMEEAKQRINDENVVNFIRQNEKVRLRFTEDLMSLLLKLDAIQGAGTIVRESRKAVIRELIKLQEIVDAIAAEKTTESEPPKNVEECVLQDKENIPEEEHVHMDIQASESNPAASFNRDLNSLENALEKKIILSDLENSLEKKIMLDEDENADNKDPPFEKNRETSPLMKIPEEKDKMGSLDENIDSSGPANYSSEPLKNSSQSVKGSSELLEDSSESVKDSSGPVTFSTCEGVNDDDVSIENQEQVSSDLPKMETNESGSAEEDFISVNREAILQEAFEMLDQIKSRIAECQLQDQIYSEVPLQGAEVANIVDQDEVKLKEFTNKPELGIHRMECSEEYHAGKKASNQGKISQQDGKHEANN